MKPSEEEAAAVEVDGASPSGFETLGLGGPLLQSLAELGYEEPTPIQREAVPPLLEGRDVLGQAATGTGKTGAFALPLVYRLQPGKSGPFEASALILVPTRELAMQVAEAVFSYGRILGVSVLPVYGGQEFIHQVSRLKRGVDVVVATPGRALDHLRRKTLKLEKVSMVVLDEADEMLDLGFADDLDAILSELPEEHQTALFSATLPPRIASIAERHLKKPVRIQIRADKTPGAIPKVRQVAYIVPGPQKTVALTRVLDVEGVKSAIVFCRTRTEVDGLTDSLLAVGFRTEPLHGGMTQEQRDRVLKRFRTGKADILVATDVAARGLHIEKLSHVINYDLPTAPEAYVHRIGRTGRAGREGVAISFAEPRERRLLATIERATRQKIQLSPLPTVEELEERRLDATRELLREAIEAGGLDSFRGVVESLAGEFPPGEIAAAAVKMIHGQSQRGTEGAEAVVEEAPIPRREPRSERRPPERRPREQLEEAPRERAAAPTEKPRRRAGEWAPHDEEAPPRRAARPESSGGPTARLFISAGKNAGVRPADVVGAIANEAGVAARDVGSIEIFPRHTTVEVPEDDVDDVIAALSKTTLRGRPIKVDRDWAQKPGARPRR